MRFITVSNPLYIQKSAYLRNPGTSAHTYMQNPTSCLSAWHWSRWSGTTGPLLMLVAFNVNMTSCLVVYNVTLWSSYTCALMGFESVLSKATQKQEMQVQMTQILNARASLCPFSMKDCMTAQTDIYLLMEVSYTPAFPGYVCLVSSSSAHISVYTVHTASKINYLLYI